MGLAFVVTLGTIVLRSVHGEELIDLRKQVDAKLYNLKMELSVQDSKHRKTLYELEKGVDGLFDSFARLDSRISSVRQTDAKIGDHLQIANSQRVTVSQTIDLIKYSSPGDLWNLDLYFLMIVVLLRLIQWHRNCRVMEQRVTALLDKLLVKPSLVNLPPVEQGGLPLYLRMLVVVYEKTQNLAREPTTLKKGGPYLAIYLWGFMFFLSIVMMTIYPILIAPFFSVHPATIANDVKPVFHCLVDQVSQYLTEGLERGRESLNEAAALRERQKLLLVKAVSDLSGGGATLW
ncbi:hypothetical protein NE237_030071 [Protea cynaroides]|uniref:Uncharacterized protein n=1 Tax=Protea cynaroides TaxID=273540 RepID=A0A9Q0JUI0_9MAGN|nr:hypothetical protein NE237_030071 [Protea cynaroides]